MWRELVESVCTECTFAPPASEQSLNDVEAALGVALPLELRSLLRESNGIGDRHGDGVLSAEQIITYNLELRQEGELDDLYMSFEPLFFFGEAGNGDRFFFPIQGNGKINNVDVFRWNHENDSREWLANNLEQFVTRWYSGQLEL